MVLSKLYICKYYFNFFDICIRWTNAEFKTFVCNENSPQKTNNNNRSFD